jgi:trimethylamine:corrinoid methyltransferase-like protein
MATLDVLEEIGIHVMHPSSAPFGGGQKLIPA